MGREWDLWMLWRRVGNYLSFLKLVIGLWTRPFQTATLTTYITWPSFWISDSRAEWWSRWAEANCSYVRILKMNVASHPSRDFYITGTNSKRLLPELRGLVLRIKGLRRQGVSAFCFDSFLLTSEPHSHLTTFYPSSGSEPPSLLCWGLPLSSASTILKPIPAALWPPLSSALALLEPPSTKP